MRSNDVGPHESSIDERGGSREHHWKPELLRLVGGTCFLVGVAATGYVLSQLFTIGTATIFTLVLAIIIGNTWKIPAAIEAASKFTLKRTLKIAIICLGAGLSFDVVYNAGALSLIAITSGVLAALAVAVIVGRFLRLEGPVGLLTGIGTAICGASAIAASSPLLRVKRGDVATIMSCIFLLNAIALLTLPAIGSWLNMDEVTFGIWAGVAVHDTASAVAAGFAYGDLSGETATVVKLMRTLFLVPLLVLLAAFYRPEEVQDGTSKSPFGRAVSAFPVFILAFVAVAFASGLDLLGGAEEYVATAGRYLILLVVAAIGLGLRLRNFASVGLRIMVVGAAASLAITIISLAVITLISV